VLMSLLSREEREVLDMIVAGKPNKAIASRLQISVRTVHIRRASLMKKLEVQSRAELVRVAVAVQLLAEAAPQHDGQSSPSAQADSTRADSAQGEARSKDANS
jgi:DNA-binding CsgD family transcriptional regulator